MDWNNEESSEVKDACDEAPAIKKTICDASEKSQVYLLKKEIARLHKVIKDLKSRLRKRKVPRKKTNKKSNKRIIQNMIEKQNLHPVAQAMIKLQLYTPNARREKPCTTIFLLLSFCVTPLTTSRLHVPF